MQKDCRRCEKPIKGQIWLVPHMSAYYCEVCASQWTDDIKKSIRSCATDLWTEKDLPRFIAYADEKDENGKQIPLLHF